MFSSNFDCIWTRWFCRCPVLETLWTSSDHSYSRLYHAACPGCVNEFMKEYVENVHRSSYTKINSMDLSEGSYLCPISCATTKTLSKCFPSLIVQLDVAVHIPATGASPTTWLLILPFLLTTYRSRPAYQIWYSIKIGIMWKFLERVSRFFLVCFVHKLTSQNDCMIKMEYIIVGHWIEFPLPHTKAVQKNVNVTGPSQFFRVRM